MNWTGKFSHLDFFSSLKCARNPKKISVEDFEIKKTLGSGGYGKVFLAKKINGSLSGQAFALKVIAKARLLLKSKDKRYAKSERNILRRINENSSPFLCTLYFAFSDASYLYLCLEYLAGGEMFQHMERQEVLNEKQASFYAAQVTLAVEHLHQMNILYRDLKSENIMLDRRGHIKLCDFGLSKILDEHKFTKTFCGTVAFMAPEIIIRLGYSFEVDWWSLGVFVHDMLVGGSPFESETKEIMKKKIINGVYSLPRGLSSGAKSLIKRFLVADPTRRLGTRVNDIKNHRFFSGIDWDRLSRLEIEPPFAPRLKDDFDVSQFDEDVINKPIQFDLIQSDNRDSEAFKDFSYTAPFAMDVKLTSQWMVCEDSDDHSSDDCEMELEFDMD